LKDNVKARQLTTEGTLAATVASNGGEPPAPFQSQVQLCEAARRAAEQRAPDLRPAAPPEPVPTLEPRAGSAA
jgi:hypothetical protein